MYMNEQTDKLSIFLLYVTSNKNVCLCTCKIVKIVRLYPNFSHKNMIVIPKRATIVYVQRHNVSKKPGYRSFGEFTLYSQYTYIVYYFMLQTGLAKKA